ncbi:MAG TPA: YbaK/EbsC family protein [bacterium]
MYSVKPTDRVLAALHAGGVAIDILEFPHSTRTAADAAAAIGTTVAQIVKSLVFLADVQPVLVLASGANRVDATKLARAAGVRSITKASADVVHDVTGFAIGGVPPVGHERPLPVYIDRDLLGFEIVFAAAGTPTSVFAIAPVLLQRLTRGTVVDLREESKGLA